MNGALTVPVEKHIINGVQWRDLTESYIKRGEAIDDANERFKIIRNIAK